MNEHENGRERVFKRKIKGFCLADAEKYVKVGNVNRKKISFLRYAYNKTGYECECVYKKITNKGRRNKRNTEMSREAFCY